MAQRNVAKPITSHYVAVKVGQVNHKIPISNIIASDKKEQLITLPYNNLE
jgi:hypothetical protein